MPDRFVCLNIFAAKFFTVTPRRLITLLLSLIITVALNSPAMAAGPLRVNPVNSRYFFDADGATVFLAGSYQNPYNLLNGDSWDLASYFDYLARHNHNFTRLWAWEQSPWMFDSNGQVAYSLQPFERTGAGLALDGGAKFDLARFNQAYFDQLRTRVIQAGQRGIYVSLILFEGFSSQRRVREINPWLADPFQRDNNINGINADPNGNGRGEEFFSLNYPSLTTLQEAFVRKVVDTLNDLDNVLYEISGDTLATSLLWQYHMIDYLKQYQSSKANQHPVGISQFYARKLAEVLSSRADWIVTEGTNFNPPLVTSNKVVFNEGHPILFTYSNPDQWVWRAFTRGYNLIYPEAVSDDAGVGERVHAAIGQSRAYSQFLNLRTMFPSTTLCSRDFCLGSQGSDYLVYLPAAGQVSIDLSAATVNFLTAWFDPVTGQTLSGDSVSGGKRTTFTSPIRGQSVLQISPEQRASGQTSSVSLNRLTPSTSNTLDFVESSRASQEMVSTPTITPNGGIYSGSVRVRLSTKTENATIHYTTDGKSPTQSSRKYTGSFTLTGSSLVKAKAFKNGRNSSAESGAWFADIGNATSAFNFTLANSGDRSVSAGSSTATTITATLSAASSQTVSFTVSGLPSGATAALSSASCTQTCSSTLTVSTSGVTPVGNYPVSVSASGGGQTRTTSFNLSVSTAPTSTLPPPTTTPSGWTSCALEDYQCSFSGTKVVRYGANGTYVSQTFSNGVYCANSVFGDPLVGIVKSCDFRDASNLPFDFSITNSGDMSVNGGASGTSSISATLLSGSTQSVSFSISGLPSGATGSFSSGSCTLTCSTVLTISTSGATPVGSYPITVISAGGGVKRSTVFTLSLTLALTVATPTISPNGGSFSDSVSVAMQSATSGSSIYYTTDGSIPTQSSSLYTGAMTLTSDATVKAAAFKNGYNPSAIAAASFSNSLTNTTGKIYYVAKTGSDSYSCAQAQNSSAPKRTVNAGAACLNGGDTLSIGAGTYNESLHNNIPNGSPSQYTRVVGAGMGLTILQPTSTKIGFGVIGFNGGLRSYIEFTGITTDSSLSVSGESGSAGFTLSASNSGDIHHLYIHDNEFKNAWCDKVAAGGSTDITFTGNWLHGGACNIAYLGGNAHGLYLGGLANLSHRWLVERNIIEGAKQYGLHVYPGGTGHIIRYNTIRNNSTAFSGAGIILYGDSHQVYGNLIYNNNATSPAHGITVRGANNHRIYNNTIYGNTGYAINIESVVSSPGATIKNNILSSNGGSLFLSGTEVSSNNICSNASPGCTVANPLFVNPANTDFRLQVGSPAIDTGVTLGEVYIDLDRKSRPRGAGYDIGAFEN